MAEASSSAAEAVARAVLDAAKDALGLVGALVADLVGRTPVSETNVCALCLFFGGLLPPTMTHVLFYPFFRLVFGTLYPAYASYKAVRTKNIKEYVKWMMYWIVFALFTCAETFTDVFLSFWFPFYYEIKIILVLWLLSPATKGSSILYRKFVHPMLSRREHEIDEYIAKAKEQGYSTVLHLGTKGVNYATSVIMQTAIKGGGGLVQQLRRSYSLSDLSTDTDMADVNRNSKSKTLTNIPDEDLEEADTSVDPRMLRSRGYSPRRSASGSGRVEMYFPEVDVDVRQHSSHPREPSITLSQIRSSEDVSSGYSSAEPLYAGHQPTKSEGLTSSREPLVRTASVGGASRAARTRSARGGVVPKRASPAEGSEQWDDEEATSQNQEQFFSISSPILNFAPIPVERSLSQTEVFLLLQHLHAQGLTNMTTSKLDSTESQKESILPSYSVPVELSAGDCQSNLDTKIENTSSAIETVNTESISVKQYPNNNEEPFPLAVNNLLQTDTSKAQTASKDTLENKEELKKQDISMDTQNINEESKDSSSTEVKECATDESTNIPAVEQLAIDQKTEVIEHFIDAVPDISESAICPNTEQGETVTSIKENDSLNLLNKSVSVEDEFVEASSGNEQIESSLQENIKSKEDMSSSVIDSESIAVVASNSHQVSSKEDLNTKVPSQDDKVNITNKSEDLQEEQLNDVKLVTKQNHNTVTEDIIQDNSQVQQADIVESETANLFPSSDTSSVKEEVVDDSNEDKKDIRSGRYHKLHAPSPPVKESVKDDIEATSDLDTADVSSVSTDTCTSGTDQSPPAVTARLVLQPGVVKSFTPESSTYSSTEKFVSNPPKSKKKSSKKQRGSAITRLFAIPTKSQLGHFASYLPFWHSPKTDSGEPNKDEGNLDKSSSSFASTTSSGTYASVAPSRISAPPMSTCSLEYLPYVGTSDELTAVLNREKSNSIGEFRMRDMSNSPPLSRRKM